MESLPRYTRVAAYALVVREGQILLSRLAPRISRDELWTLPGGGVEHGEDPRDSVIREVAEETGLAVEVSDTTRVYSAHLPGVPREGRIVDGHAIRIIYDGWVAKDAPEPRVVEVDGSTVEAAWHDLAAVRSGAVPVVQMVREALADHEPYQRQRLAAYALIVREAEAGPEVLLTRISERGYHSGSWTLPGGGVEHGEPPAVGLAREVLEETGVECEVGQLLDVHDVHFSGVAPSGRFEDFHGVHLIFAGVVDSDADPQVIEVDGTTDQVAWVPVRDIQSEQVPVLDVVRHALLSRQSGSAPR